jgi:hypothetical protein
VCVYCYGAAWLCLSNRSMCGAAVTTVQWTGKATPLVGLPTAKGLREFYNIYGGENHDSATNKIKLEYNSLPDDLTYCNEPPLNAKVGYLGVPPTLPRTMSFCYRSPSDLACSRGDWLVSFACSNVPLHVFFGTRKARREYRRTAAH